MAEAAEEKIRGRGRFDKPEKAPVPGSWKVGALPCPNHWEAPQGAYDKSPQNM